MGTQSKMVHGYIHTSSRVSVSAAPVEGAAGAVGGGNSSSMRNLHFGLLFFFPRMHKFQGNKSIPAGAP